MKRILGIFFVWAISLITAKSELPTVEWMTATWFSGHVRVKFVGDGFEMLYPKKLPSQMRQLGFTDVPFAGGGIWPIPNYVLNVHQAALATKRKWAEGGYPIDDSSIPTVFYIEDSGSSNARGELFRAPLDIHNYFDAPELYVQPTLDPTQAIATTVHEWTHVAQTSELGKEWEILGYWIGFIEGTAKWSEDLPIRCNVRGVQVKKTAMQSSKIRVVQLEADSSLAGSRPVSLDQINMPNRNRLADLIWGANENHMFRHGGYGTHAFWKFFAQRSTASNSLKSSRENNMKAIMEFGKAANEYYWFDYGAFIKTAGSLLPEEGEKSIDNFRYFFQDFTAAATRMGSKGGLDDRFVDDAFDYLRLKDVAHSNLVFGDSASTLPTAIPQEEARNEQEIKQRLATVARESAPIRALGWVKGTIELGRLGKDKLLPPPYDRRRIFLLALGNHRSKGHSEMTLAALAAHGDREWISPKVTMDRLKMSLQSSDPEFVNDRYAAYTSLGSFHTKGGIERILLAIGNIPAKDQTQSAAVGYIVAPRFVDYLPATWNPLEGLSGGAKPVWLVSSTPKRDMQKESLRGGETLEYEVGISSQVHLGSGVLLPPENTTLKVTLISPSGAELDLEDLRFNYKESPVTGWKAKMPSYRVRFTLPKKLEEEGRYTVRFDVSSLLRLGPDDRDRTEVTFLAGRLAPQVTSVLAEGKEKTYYDSQGEVFLPIPPGKCQLRIAFDRKLDSASGKTKIKLGEQLLSGALDPEGRVWKGTIHVPKEVEAFSDWHGLKSLQISAVSDQGIPLDSKPHQDGVQPDTEHELFFGVEPPWVLQLSAEVDGELVYDADWRSVEGEADRKDWRVNDSSSPRRELKYLVRERIPESAQEAVVEFLLHSAVEDPPLVKIDGDPVEVRGTDDEWSFTLPLAEEFENGDPAKPIQIEIRAEDRYGYGLDSDPGTMIEISEDGEWAGYEHAFSGGFGDGKGGPDLWHQLNLETDPEWLEENREGRRKNFTLLQRGDEMIARFDGLDYRGARSPGTRQWTLRADPTLEYSLSTPWYDEESRQRIPTPMKAIQEAYRRGTGDLYYLKKVNEVSNPESSWKFQGEEHTFILRWDEEDNLTQVRPPSRWTQIRWKPVTPEIEDPEPESPSEDAPEDELPDDEPVTTLTSYQLEDRSVGSMKIVSVKRISFRQQGDAGARLVVTSYPVSYIEDRSGSRGLSYNVQWSSGTTVSTKFTIQKENIPGIRAEYDRLSDGGFSRSEVDQKLQAVFGENSRPLYAENAP